MGADWDDVRHAINGLLTFTPAQADLIRDKGSKCCVRGKSVEAVGSSVGLQKAPSTIRVTASAVVP